MSFTATTAVATGGPDISLIQKLTNISDVNRLLHETLARERQIDADLDKLLGKRAELERSFLLLNAPTVEMLELVHADCEQLLSSASSTAELATHISSKVRCLDTVQTAVGSVLGKISLILDCSAAVSGVQAAMESEDYEAAAHHIATFTELDARLAAGSRGGSQGGAEVAGMAAVSPDLGQAESQRQVLMEAKQKLQGVVAKQLEDAIARRDKAAVERFARLYKPLGKQAEGLKKFVEFLQLTVGAQVRGHVNTISETLDAGKKLDWTVALSLVFQAVGAALEAHEQFVAETFGAAAVVELVSGLQVECDHAGGRVISRFMEVRRVAHLVKEATSRRGKGSTAGAATGGGAGGAADGGVDHRALEQAILELLSLCRVTEEYNQFMLGRMRQAAGGSLTATRETSFRSGALNVAVRELLGHYMSLEEMYMYEATNLAISTDQVRAGSLTSYMVDEVFVILRNVGMRVLATGSVQVMCALLMEVSNVAANPLRNALATRLAGGPTKLLAAAPVEDSEAAGALLDISHLPPAAQEYAVALNNSDAAAEYMAQLKAQLEGYLGELFPATPSAGSERERVRTVLQDLHKTAGELRQAASRAVEQLAEGVLPRLRPALDQAAAASYSLGEEEYAAGDGSSAGWVVQLLLSLKSGLSWMAAILTTNNYEGCVGAVLDKLVSRLEALVARKNFSQLGGLALERDLRTLANYVSEHITQRTVRDKFARLNQMALVLGLESVEEVREYWGADSGVTWRLSAAEVKAVMAQRPDVSREALNVLHLA